MNLSPWTPIPKGSRSMPEWAGVGLLVHATLERVGRARLGIPRAHRTLASLDELAQSLARVCMSHGAATMARRDEAMAILCRQGAASAPQYEWADAVAVEATHSIYLPTGARATTRWDRVDLTPGAELAHVIDWKTAEPEVSEASMADDAQVARYLLGARSVYPFAKAHRVSFVWLGSDRVHSVTWAPELDSRIRFAAARGNSV